MSTPDWPPLTPAVPAPVEPPLPAPVAPGTARGPGGATLAKRCRLYILDGQTPQPAADVASWDSFMATGTRQVADTILGPIRVRTVFSGIALHTPDDQPPLLFDTVVFGGPLAGHRGRYPTWAAAEQGHAQAVAHVHQATSEGPPPARCPTP
jgi:hypothetical protein